MYQSIIKSVSYEVRLRISQWASDLCQSVALSFSERVGDENSRRSMCWCVTLHQQKHKISISILHLQLFIPAYLTAPLAASHTTSKSAVFFLAIEIRIYVEMYIIYFTESLFVFIVLYPFVPFLWLSIPYLFYLPFHSVRARILEFMMSTGVRPPPPINDFTLFTGHQLHNLSASISGQGLGSIFGLGSASKTLTSESPLKSSDQRWEQRICRY